MTVIDVGRLILKRNGVNSVRNLVMVYLAKG